jgi:sugar-specific transcriptional regulator TrmB
LVENIIRRVLRDTGLSDRESEVYLFLTKEDLQYAINITRSLRMHKAQVYRILKTLQKRGIVESCLENPARFSAIPFDKLLDKHINNLKEEASLYERNRDELISQWKSTLYDDQKPHPDKFMIIEGRERMYSKITEMIIEANKELAGIITSENLVNAEQRGVIDCAKKRKIQYKLIIDLTIRNYKTMNELFSTFTTTPQVRHKEIINENLPRFIIKDEEDIILFLKPFDTNNQDSSYLWSNNKIIVNALKMLFEKLWIESTDINKKIKQFDIDYLLKWIDLPT